MASPQSSVNYDGTSAPKKHEQITFRFCSECSNMLYPKEDEDAHKLQFTCRTCQYTEEAQSTCVFRNDLNTSAGETAGVTQDVGSDPTVSGALAHNNKPVLPAYICLCCGTHITCIVCSKPYDRDNVDTFTDVHTMHPDDYEDFLPCLPDLDENDKDGYLGWLAEYEEMMDLDEDDDREYDDSNVSASGDSLESIESEFANREIAEVIAEATST